MIDTLPEEKLEALLIDPAGEKTGSRLRTLADRLAVDDKRLTTSARKRATVSKRSSSKPPWAKSPLTRRRRRNTTKLMRNSGSIVFPAGVNSP